LSFGKSTPAIRANCHSPLSQYVNVLRLTLALLVARVLGTDNPQHSAPPNDFAVLTPLLYR
jgi:hypothetical protein